MLRFVFLSAVLTVLSPFTLVHAEETAIDRYIQAEDNSFKWKVVDTQAGDGCTTFVIDMTSQTWRTPDEVNRTEWQHWITVVVPDEVVSTTGFVMIGGGSNGREAPTQAEPRFVRMAKLTGTVVAELGMIPNQPLVFHGDGEQRGEDNIIGYTWNQFIRTGDPTWLARAPMTKSVVRAMDALTEMMASEQGGKRVLDKFVVAGGSKRGWTTWITAAMDKRVVAIMPIVIDVLNTRESMKHHFAAYGFWAPAIGDYVRHRITQRMDDPKYDEINKLVDPLSYRDRLTMPKFILNAAGDQFFLPDSSKFYWDKLNGSKSIRYVPNTDHGMGSSDVFDSMVAFYWLIVNGKPIPKLTWSFDDGSWAVQASVKPQEVRHWQATNPVARDFRKETLGAKYTSELLTADAQGGYSAKLEAPPEGWTASFVEATFDVGAPLPIKMTTNVVVAPDVLPFAGKDAKLDPSLTVTCEAQDGRVAKQVLSTLEKLVAAGALKAPEFSAEQLGSRIYVNWRPAIEDFSEAAGGLTKLLSDKGCTNFAYQLESGLGATIAPGLMQPAANP